MNLASLKGVHYAIKSGCSRPSPIYAALKRGESSFENYEQVVEDSIIGKTCGNSAHAPALPESLIRGGPLVQPDDRH